ncbi:WD40 repeat domain-containing protein [Scytonema millei]|uniref:Uncharacterized protein n=1 Tax=Scytonema millei VB511283 TaxID=1245923 RepID=A0A9X5I8B3_9CYAN|nr:PD40 domain-containing protein [Scytonema millei]NHC37922.1 hypothetical protein [Scytonema millei VB511283]
MAGNFQHFKKFTLSHTWETTWCIASMALSPDGTILVYSEFDDWTFKDSGFDVFDLTIGQQVCYFDTGRIRGYGRSFALSPNGRKIVWRSGNTITVGDLTIGKGIRTFQDSAGSIAVSPDGKSIICFSPEIAKMFDVETG